MPEAKGIEIPAADLLPLDLFAGDAPFTIDLAYAQADHPHNHFPGLYHPQAQLTAHRLLVPVLLRAARAAKQRGVTLQLLDCFRPIEAQERMATHGYPPELVSRPGFGPHPRGLAIDLQLLVGGGFAVGQPLDMGTPFDFFTEDLARNPAARDWPGLTAAQRSNRKMLDEIMHDAAGDLPLAGLPQEWWDYRVPPDFYNRYAPVRETDLPPALHMTQAPASPTEALHAAWQQARSEILSAL